jgi:hypothetical protein
MYVLHAKERKDKTKNTDDMQKKKCFAQDTFYFCWQLAPAINLMLPRTSRQYTMCLPKDFHSISTLALKTAVTGEQERT